MRKLKAFFRGIYAQLVREHDTPRHLACGFGLGVFLGILPFTGGVAAVALAAVFKVNKAAALLGSVLTNTWLSVVTFAAAGRIGCWLLGEDWVSMGQAAHDIIFKFRLESFLGTASLKILLPLMLGYVVVGAGCGIFAFLVILLILRRA